MSLNDGQIGQLTKERLFSRLKGLHYFVCHLSDHALGLQVLTKCIESWTKLNLSQIGLSATIERKNNPIDISWQEQYAYSCVFGQNLL